MIAVAEACRNVSCTGAEPVALTDGLNFGNPETNDVQFQLMESIRGIRDAALAFGVPVVSGNASLYNESRGRAIFPTPMIGALGLLDDVSRRAAAGFKTAGDVVAVIGANEPWDTVGGLMGSEMAYVLHDWIGGRPAIDLSNSRYAFRRYAATRSGKVWSIPRTTVHRAVLRSPSRNRRSSEGRA